MPRSIRTLLILSATAVALLLMGGLYFLISITYNQTIHSDAERVSGLVAKQTFNTMYQVMSRGWDRDELEQFLANTRDNFKGTPYQVQIYRGPVVEQRFGVIEQPPFDDEINQALATGEAEVYIREEGIRHLYPLVAESACLRCHTNASAGQVLGVIDVQQNMLSVLQRARSRFMYVLLLLLPIPPLAAFFVARHISRRIERGLDQVREDIAEVNSLSDLTRISFAQNGTGFRELDEVLVEADRLSQRLRSMAVDRELLEFEIQVLERFVLTSDVIRDWRDHVGQLLIEINRFLPAYALFSLFRMKDDLVNLEIFWSGPPSEHTKHLMEQEIHLTFHNENVLGNSYVAKIDHHIVKRDAAPIELEVDEIRMQSKSLLLQKPQIGGIVGIGVQAMFPQDSLRNLVIESILSTLLNVVGSVKAISRYTQDLEYYATRDPLTNLYNQRVFWELLGYEVKRAERHDHRFALLVIDLDDFKSINDTYGHATGDDYLQRFADLIHGELRQGDVFARYGGDEFVILLPEIGEGQTEVAAERVRAAAENLKVETERGEAARSSTSIGIAIYPDHARSAKDLFLFADNMMYQAKTEGKNRSVVPTDEVVLANLQEVAQKTAWVQKAIADELVVPYFQPIARSEDGAVCAFEVLARIPLDEHNIMSAAQFVEIVERKGLIRNMDRTVMDKAFKIASESGYEGYLFINISPKALVLEEFFSMVRELVQHYRFLPDKIVFELTERETVASFELLEQFIRKLKVEGFRFAIDDFGSGFSSFHYIKRFPIDFIKIEGEFIACMLNGDRDRALVNSIADLARDFGIQTVAEYVENEEVLVAVRNSGIDYVQGFHIGHPTPDLKPISCGCGMGRILEGPPQEPTTA